MPQSLPFLRRSNALNVYLKRVTHLIPCYPPYNKKTSPTSLPVVLTLGSVHVACGYVDLSCLFVATLQEDPDFQGPLRFVGVEASPFAVAKTKVVARMCEMQLPTAAILEVWYSAAWSQVTLDLFRRALDAVRGSSKDVRVLCFLDHWSTCELVPLKEARTRWLDSIHKGQATTIGTFTHKADRVAYMQYVLTGDLFLKSSVMGSLTMWTAPLDACVSKEEDEIFLGCLHLKALMARRKQESNIVRAGISLLQRGVDKIKAAMRDGLLVVDLRDPEQLSLGNSQCLASIQSLQPYSMGWSNIVDYHTRRDFLEMARACSSKETLHHVYSMNWVCCISACAQLALLFSIRHRLCLRSIVWIRSSPRSIFSRVFTNTSWTFLTKPQCCLIAGGIILDWARGVGEEYPRKSFVEAGKQSVKMQYRLVGADYLVPTPMTHPINFGEYALAHAFRQKWVDSFFQGTHVALSEMCLYSMFSRANSTCNVLFTFDNSMKFKGQ